MPSPCCTTWALALSTRCRAAWPHKSKKGDGHLLLCKFPEHLLLLVQLVSASLTLVGAFFAYKLVKGESLDSAARDLKVRTVARLRLLHVLISFRIMMENIFSTASEVAHDPARCTPEATVDDCSSPCLMFH